MLPFHKINEAYDLLNLPRDASIQAVRDRVDLLRDRLNNQQDPSRREKIEEAFRTLETADSYLKAQREAINARTRSRSERVLDGKLTELSVRTGSLISKRAADEADTTSKRAKTENPGETTVKPEDATPSTQAEDDKVFEKLNAILMDDSKYVRAVLVLFNMISKMIDSGQMNQKFVDRISASLDLVAGPVASSNEDTRKASTKVVNLVLATDDVKSRLKPEHIARWSHAVIFRNSLFEVDNFNFVKRCKELVSLISEAKDHKEDGKWLNELLVSVELLASTNVARVIPGRINDVKTAMIEIFKLTRSNSYPAAFRDKISNIQKQFMSSLS
jgi:hypothetical protein